MPPEARPEVVSWVDRVKALGIRSILCLLELDQLDGYYMRGGLNIHANGLLGYYKERGFDVYHFPMTDYKRPTEALMGRVLEEFDRLPKPVLIHCSAAIDRTTPVAAFIAARRDPQVGSLKPQK